MGKMKTNFYLDLFLVIIFLLLMEPKLTGLVLHELVGLAISLAFLTHIIFHWKWVVETTKKYFKLNNRSRIKYILDILLFTGFITILISGLAISKTINFSWLNLGDDMVMWKNIHIASSYITILLIGVHVGLNWKWVMNTSKRLLKNNA